MSERKQGGDMPRLANLVIDECGVDQATRGWRTTIGVPAGTRS